MRLEAGCEGKEGEQGRRLLGTCLKVKGPLGKESKSGCHASKARWCSDACPLGSTLVF